MSTPWRCCGRSCSLGALEDEAAMTPLVERIKTPLGERAKDVHPRPPKGQLSLLVMHGEHSRPLARRVAAGKKVFWASGDWGTDNHEERDGNLGAAELGGGANLGSVQLNLSLGKTWGKQNLSLAGEAKSDGTYLMAEALLPLPGKLWATFDAYGMWGEADVRGWQRLTIWHFEYPVVR
ncbi:MAG: hypothetical protein Q8K62_10840 [Thiobacillus sp.]|nr:hypothetical protein [Thiobacillus sp.]